MGLYIKQPFPREKQSKLRKKLSTSAGFEPTRETPMRFLVSRLNHSAKASVATLV